MCLDEDEFHSFSNAQFTDSHIASRTYKDSSIRSEATLRYANTSVACDIAAQPTSL